MLSLAVKSETIHSGQSSPQPSVHIYKSQQLVPLYIVSLKQSVFHIAVDEEYIVAHQGGLDHSFTMISSTGEIVVEQ